MPTAIANIPSGATTLIGRWCEGTLTSVSTSTVNQVNSIANSLFGGTARVLEQPNIKSISDEALASATPLAVVTLNGVTSVGKKAFKGCTSLESVSLNTCNSFAKETFSGCSKLQTVSINSCTSLSSLMFNGCTALKTLNAEKLTAIGNAFFDSFSNLTTVNTPNCTSVGSSAFNNCPSLKSVRLGTLSGGFPAAFSNCYSLTSIVFNCSSVLNLSDSSTFKNCYHLYGTVDATYNPNGDKDCYIYVPDALVDSYKTTTGMTDTYWALFADQIKPLSEYTG